MSTPDQSTAAQIPDDGPVTSDEQRHVPQTETLTIAKAITRALADELAADEKVLLMGEDIGSLGGVYRVTEGLKAAFGADRVVDSPLAESGIIGTSIGLAMRGYRPVAEIQFDGFVFPGFNQITTQLAKMRARTQGTREVPVTIRIPYGGGIGSIDSDHLAVGPVNQTGSSLEDALLHERGTVMPRDTFRTRHSGVILSLCSSIPAQQGGNVDGNKVGVVRDLGVFVSHKSDSTRKHPCKGSPPH